MVRPYGRHSALRLLLLTVILSVCVSLLPIGVDGVVFDNTIAQCTAVSKQQRKVGGNDFRSHVTTFIFTYSI